jgi:hypothetical protein
MENKKYCLGLLIIVIVFGTAIIGCERSVKQGNDNNQNGILHGFFPENAELVGQLTELSNKSITITEFNYSLYSNRLVNIFLYMEYDFLSIEENFPIVRGFAEIISDDVKVSDEKLTFSLRQNGIWATGEADWNGVYYIMIYILDEENIKIEKTYIFTNEIIPNEQFTNIPKYSINGNDSINISFNLFSEIVLR